MAISSYISYKFPETSTSLTLDGVLKILYTFAYLIQSVKLIRNSWIEFLKWIVGKVWKYQLDWIGADLNPIPGFEADGSSSHITV
jgi:hypothetical protein